MTSTTAHLRAPRSACSVRAVVATSPVWRVGAGAAVVAAIATTLFALGARAIDVPLAVGGDEIAPLGFGVLTLALTAVGTGLAIVLSRDAAHRPDRTFVVTTLALMAISFVPDVTADATSATKLTLALSHVLAAAIVIPALATRLSHQK